MNKQGDLRKFFEGSVSNDFGTIEFISLSKSHRTAEFRKLFLQLAWLASMVFMLIFRPGIFQLQGRNLIEATGPS